MWWFYLSYLMAISDPSMPPVQPAMKPPTWYGGRVFTSETLHVGVRPAVDIGRDGTGWSYGAGATVQVTLNFPGDR